MNSLNGFQALMCGSMIFAENVLHLGRLDVFPAYRDYVLLAVSYSDLETRPESFESLSLPNAPAKSILEIRVDEVLTSGRIIDLPAICSQLSQEGFCVSAGSC